MDYQFRDWGVVVFCHARGARLTSPLRRAAPQFECKAQRQIFACISRTSWSRVDDLLWVKSAAARIISPEGQRHVVYFSRYLPASDPMFGAPDEHVIRLMMPHIQRMFPEFDLRSIRAAHVW
jgi:hypothetical protein